MENKLGFIVGKEKASKLCPFGLMVHNLETFLAKRKERAT